LGPTLQVIGSSNFTSFHLAIPLPELLWFYISPLPRAPSRFVLMATLCLGILSAISLKHINSWFDKLKRGKIIGIFFIIFLSVAFWAEVNVLPYHVTENTSVPTFYSDLSRMNGAFSVLDLPHDYSADNRYMYYGTVSEKLLVGGSISRIAPENVQFLQVFPVMSQTDFVKNGGDPANWADIILQDVNTSNLLSFNLFNVKYLVLHRYLLGKMAFEKMNAYLNGLLGQPVFSDERIVAFGTTTHQLNKMSAFCSKGWWDVEEWAGQPTRWSDGNGTIKVMSPASAYYNVSFFTKTAIESKNLTVFLNGEEVGKFQIPIDTFSSIMIDGLLFNRGLNELTFYSEQSFIPLEVLPNSTDIRRMSIAFQNVSILPQDSTHR
jgi:hypothetical protein